MLGSIPHQKFCFYHLPTRGRAGIKLGDAWYVSNVSIIFFIPCYYIICFGCLMGFNMHFYIIFGTNLLTEGPVQIAVFFAYFSVLQKRNIKRNPNRMKPSGTWFSEQTWSRGLGVHVLLPPIYTYVPPNQQKHPRKPNFTAATFCTREIPSWGLFRRSAGGGIDHEGLLHQHHSLSDDVWVVYHRPSGP